MILSGMMNGINHWSCKRNLSHCYISKEEVKSKLKKLKPKWKTSLQCKDRHDKLIKSYVEKMLKIIGQLSEQATR
jgi:hypothetical protein